MRRMTGPALLAALLSVAAFAVVAQAGSFTDWQAAKKLDEVGGNNSELNTPSLDGCPIQSPDGLQPVHGVEPARRRRACSTSGSRGGRTRRHPWGAPENLGEPVNSAADDFCPTPDQGRRAVLRQP